MESAYETIKDTTKSTFRGFVDFLTKRNIIQMVTAFVIAGYVTDMSKEFTSIIIDPITDKLFSKEKKIQDITVDLFGMKMRMGRLIYLVIRFLIVVFLLYLLFGMLPDKLLGIDFTQMDKK